MEKIEKLFYLASGDNNQFNKNYFVAPLKNKSGGRTGYVNSFKNSLKQYYLILNKNTNTIKISKIINVKEEEKTITAYFEVLKEEKNINVTDLMYFKHFAYPTVQFAQASQTYEIALDKYSEHKDFNFLLDKNFSFKNEQRNILICKEKEINNIKFSDMDIVFKLDNYNNLLGWVNIFKDNELQKYETKNQNLNVVFANKIFGIQRLDLKVGDKTYLKRLNEKLENNIYVNDKDISTGQNYFYNSIICKLADFNKNKNQVKKEKIMQYSIQDKLITTHKILKQKISENLQKYLNSNTIFYGVPGCGKSHHIKELLQEVNSTFYKRVLFHPEYTYSDFVGQIMPKCESGNVTYEFNAGPFTEILKSANKDTAGNQYFLIVEEINRGNAPAIFGDIFQLLDRNKDGSEYKIYNKEIAKYVYNDENTQVGIPSNLTILATMNTCDQNVFTLDTAFKRRWRMTRIKSDFNSDDKILKVKIKDKGITWRDFGRIINNAILSDKENLNSEDKQFGVHFVKENELGDAQVFAEKVLMYLWEDVAKYNKQIIFANNVNTLDNAIDEFVNGEWTGVFNESIADEFNEIINQN